MTEQIRYTTTSGQIVRVLGAVNDDRTREILSDEALDFLAFLHTKMEPQRRELLQAREDNRAARTAGTRPSFEKATRSIRADNSWRVATLAPGLKDRRAEICGPAVDRKMAINALNSGAKVWLADFEDSASPTWENMINAQINLYDSIRQNIEFIDETSGGKHYRLAKPALAQQPTIMPRPRGLHLDETHILVNDEPIAGSLMDFALYFFHSAHELVRLGRGPYFYLPKIEHHLEARWWNVVFNRAQEYLNIPHGTIRATVMIEDINAAFQMEEILYQLRDHSAGLNAGRWDYIFSIIRNFRDSGADFVLPDRGDITMDQSMMQAYTDLLIWTCHRRGAHAIGGMTAFIPDRNDKAANKQALEEVRADKQREAQAGFDGSWVAHPDLVPVCMRVYDELLFETPHQIRTNKRGDVIPDAEALLNVSATTGSITLDGVRENISAPIYYLDSWLRGEGAVAINGLMEDSATAEISRAQIWQWVHYGSSAVVNPETGEEKQITREWIQELTDEFFATLPRSEGDRFDDARELFIESALSEEFVDSLTVLAYDRFLSHEAETAQQAAPAGA